MTTTDKIVKVLNEAKGRFNRTLGIKTLALFGSFARGEQTDKSDIDVLVDMSKPSFDGYMDLKFFLEDRFKTKVDLVLEDTVKPLLRERIIREMIRA